MGAHRALVVSSGMGALDVITRLLRPGDEVVTGDDLYGGTNRLLKYLASNGGIVVRHVDTTDTDAVREVLSTKTAMVLLETPTNPLIKIVDIPAIAAAAHSANPSAVVCVDNTMLSPLLQNPLELGADISYESGTKYLSGHHDVMAGVLAVSDPALSEKLFFTINASGCGLSPFDSWLPAPWHQDAGRAHGKAAEQCPAHRRVSIAAWLPRQVSRTAVTPAVRAALEHGTRRRGGAELRDGRRGHVGAHRRERAAVGDQRQFWLCEQPDQHAVQDEPCEHRCEHEDGEEDARGYHQAVRRD